MFFMCVKFIVHPCKILQTYMTTNYKHSIIIIDGNKTIKILEYSR
jgi:hypothetical protein